MTIKTPRSALLLLSSPSSLTSPSAAGSLISNRFFHGDTKKAPSRLAHSVFYIQQTCRVAQPRLQIKAEILSHSDFSHDIINKTSLWTCYQG